MRKIHKHPKKENLYHITTTLFIGNKNQIEYYRDKETGRTYAKAKFDYMEESKLYLYEEWWQIAKADIKDEESQTRTEKEICFHFGWISIERNRAI